MSEIKQFSRCCFCRISCSNFRDHIYSDKHKRKVLAILKKFKTKVKQAKVLQKVPEVESANWERDSNFWCHFCEEEHARHVHLEEAAIKFGGFLKHISEVHHAEMVEKFWCHQRLRDQKTDSYTISLEKYNEFEHKALMRVKEYMTERDNDFAKKVADFKKIEDRREQEVFSVPESVSLSHETMHKTEKNRTMQGVVTKGYRTVAAKGDGLTCINIQNTGSRVHGNIYTDATPPWMVDEPKTASMNSTIGPTQEDFKKHLLDERKKKLPAERVGATVTEECGGADWMPAFGRVWSKHSRQQQRKWPFKSGRKTNSNRHVSGANRMEKKDFSVQSNGIRDPSSASCSHGDGEFTGAPNRQSFLPQHRTGEVQNSGIHERGSISRGHGNAEFTDESGRQTLQPCHRTGELQSNGIHELSSANFALGNGELRGESGQQTLQPYHRTGEVQGHWKRQYAGFQESSNMRNITGGNNTMSQPNGKIGDHGIHQLNRFEGESRSSTASQIYGASAPVQTVARGYVRKKHSNNVGLGKIEISQNLL